MDTKVKIINGVKWTTYSTIIVTIVAILRVSILTRFLDRGDFGVFAIIIFVLGFIELFNDMGISTAILSVKEISKYQYSSLYWINWVLSFLVYFLIFIISPIVSDFYNLSELVGLLSLLGLNLIFSAIGRQFKIIEQKNLLFKSISLIDIIVSVLSLFLAVILAYFNFGIYSLVYSLLFQILFSNISYFIVGIRRYGLLFHFNLNEIKKFFKIGVYQVGAQFINYFNRDMDILLIGKFFGPDILGGYSLARDLVRKPSAVILPVINKVGAPLLAKIKDSKSDLNLYFLKLTEILSVVTIYLFLGIIILSYPLVLILYGKEYLSIVILVQILSINMIFRIITGNIGNLIVATGRTDLDFKWNILTLFVTPLSVYIGSFFGIVGVACMVSLSMLILFTPNYYYVIKKLLPNLRFKEYCKAFFTINPTVLLKIKKNERF